MGSDDETAALKARVAALEGKQRKPSGCGTFIVVIGAVALIGGAMSAMMGESAPTTAEKPRAAALTAYHARAMVKARLKDPASAKFGEVFQPSAEVVCGSVNARNGFGGRTGQRRFVATPLVVILEDDEAPAKFVKVWNANCGSGAAK